MTARLQMRACRAARAFACRRIVRRSRRQRMPWRPVVLLWQRAVALAGRAPGVLGSATQPVGRSPWQLHLHLQVDAGAAPQPGTRTTPNAQAATKRAPNMPTELRRESQRNDPRTSASDATITKSRDTARTAVLRPSVRVVPKLATIRAETRRRPPVATMQLRPRPSAPSGARLTEGRASVTSRPATQPVTLRRQRPHQSKAANSVAARKVSAIAAFATRSPDLVWRTREPTPTDTIESTEAQVTNPPPPARAESATLEPPTEFPNAQAAHTALRTQPLDPTFVDRVADDVIRRIDRHLRIERERRGL